VPRDRPVGEGPSKAVAEPVTQVTRQAVQEHERVKDSKFTGQVIPDLHQFYRGQSERDKRVWAQDSLALLTILRHFGMKIVDGLIQEIKTELAGLWEAGNWVPTVENADPDIATDVHLGIWDMVTGPLATGPLTGEFSDFMQGSLRGPDKRICDPNFNWSSIGAKRVRIAETEWVRPPEEEAEDGDG
jgi:hypothetical protein